MSACEIKIFKFELQLCFGSFEYPSFPNTAIIRQRKHSPATVGARTTIHATISLCEQESRDSVIAAFLNLENSKFAAEVSQRQIFEY